MTESELLKHFPNMSRSCLSENLSAVSAHRIAKKPVAGDSVQNKSIPDNSLEARHIIEWATSGVTWNETKFLTITLSGVVKGGKNNMVVTRSGLHFPKKSWAKWRDEKVAEVKAQLPNDWSPITVPTDIELEYIAGDRRRRDQPAIIDAIFHVLEKAGVASDDTHLWISSSTRSYDKKNPKAIIRIPIVPQ